MTRTPDSAQSRRQPPASLRLRLFLARLALAWEALWPALWPVAALAALFVALSGFGLFSGLAPWWHLVLLLAFAAGALWLLWRGRGAWRWPGADAARRRLERASGLEHRPLLAWSDELAAPGADAAAGELWKRHVERLRQRIRALRIGPPQPGVAARDPLGLRFAALALLIVAAIAAGPQLLPRLQAAAQPDFAGVRQPMDVDLWVTPPAYTRIPPVYRRWHTGAEGTTAPVRVPEGSEVMVRVAGPQVRPELALPAGAAPLDAIDATSFRGAGRIESGGEIAIVLADRTLVSWPVEIARDIAPSIEFSEDPRATPRYSLQLDYEAYDDYRLTGLDARITLPDGGADAGEIALELPEPPANESDVDERSFHDLTAHPWAGLPVRIRLSATDDRGQRGSSLPVDTVLPERPFNHPVAKRLIEARKQLTLNPDERAPAIETLDALTRQPETYDGDIAAHLGMRVALSRLLTDQQPGAVGEVQNMMWRTALRLEEGKLADAEQRLRQAQKELLDALARDDVDDAELDRLMDELQAALDQYLRALSQRLAGNEDLDKLAEALRNQRMTNAQNLGELLDRARELSQSGARDAARDLLSRLRNMLENLDLSQQGQQQREQMEITEQLLERLRELTDEQRELLDRTFREANPGSRELLDEDSREPPQASPGELGEDQNALRRKLGGVMRELSEQFDDIPPNLGAAERAMRGAEDELGEGRLGAATEEQKEALRQLRQGAESMAQRLQQGQQGGSSAMIPLPGEGATDPLGRSTEDGTTGADVDGEVGIPSETEMKRSREILEELRRRSGERDRPGFELDYLERLLRRF